MTLQHTYDIFSQQIELSVHDNVLLVHQLESSTVMVLDLRAPTTGPISSPLPLHVAPQQASLPLALPLPLPLYLPLLLRLLLSFAPVPAP